MRRSGLLAIIAPAVALVASACSIGGPPGSTVVTSAADPSTSASPASALATAATGPKPAALPRKSAAGASVTLTAVGDMMLGNTPDLPPDPGTYFQAVKPELKNGAQIVFGNLEGTLTTATTSKCGSKPGSGCFAFRIPPGYARDYKRGGFTVLNDANNHSHDFGAAGLTQTVRSIHATGLAQTGLPGEITRLNVKGVPVAFVAFAPYAYTASLLDLPAARALIGRAARTARIVVVYMHAGAEGVQADHVTGREEIYLGEDRGNPEAFAHMAIDAGASLVIASGPLVLRGMQFYKGHLIAYSLGNFAGYGNFSIHGDMTMSAILRVTLSSSGRFDRARLRPVLLAGTGRPVPGGGAISFVARLSAADFGASAARISPSGVITRAK
jgi:poly-gamma-glutamate capsule biosynthesis protein CapA/YwtB (metallophosphatase superfamily)